MSVLVGTKYNKATIDESYDAIVIGSGMSGLTAAALMSRAGRRVLVLERHYTAGGFTHSYLRKGFEWDVGVHYIGEVHKRLSPMRQAFDLITEGRLQWAHMGEVTDSIIMGDERFDYRKGRRRVRADLIERFPDEVKAIDAYFVNDYRSVSGKNNQTDRDTLDKITKELRDKKPGEIDSSEVQNIKGLIRRGEAKAGCRYVGIPEENAHFLDMPFYETGKVKKNPISQADVDIIVDLLRKIKPHQVYAAGDLSDPHGTHRVCLMAIFRALEQIKNEGDEWLSDCWVWLYRGAWQEWELENIDMAVPLSPPELMRKRRAIFKHQSQKDRPLFPGHDSREFWQRAEDRNRGTAKAYDQLGLAEYEAIEAFKRYYF